MRRIDRGDGERSIVTARILVFARPPIAGRVKTRLAAGVGEAVALRAYRTCLARAVAAAQGVGGEVEAVALSAEGDRAALAELVPAGMRIESQAQGDLGARLVAAFADTLDPASGDGIEVAIAVGSDCPGISPGLLAEAIESLSTHDLVLGPCDDGGYYLIGLHRRAWPAAGRLFDGIPWSTDEVFDATFARAETMGLRTAVLERLYDLDTPEDLARALRERVLVG